MRKLPVFFLLDTSGSMKGEPIQALNNALSSLIYSLRSDAYTLDTVCLSIISFDSQVKELVPLTDISNFSLPEIVPSGGVTFIGKALEMLCNKVLELGRDNASYYQPLLFLVTDGKPTDAFLYNEMVKKIHDLDFGAIVVCSTGGAFDNSKLSALTSNLLHLETIDSASLMKYFRRDEAELEDEELPPPPSELNIVI